MMHFNRALTVTAAVAGVMFAAFRPQDAVAEKNVSLAVTLKLHDVARLDERIRQQSDPGSPLYRRFLTPAQFRETYAPSAADYDATVAALRRRGFAIGRTYDSRTLIDVSGSGATVERAFGVDFAPNYDGIVPRVISQRAQRSNTTPDLLDIAAVSGRESDVGGVPLKPESRRSNAVAGSTVAAIGPDSGYTPAAFLRAFDYPLLHGFDGRGTTIASVSDGATDTGLPAFLHYYGINATFPQAQVIQVNGPGRDVTVADLSVEWIYATAPGAHVIEYETPSLSNANIVDAFNRIVTDNFADVVNVPFGACETDTTLAFAVLPVVKQAAAQGMTFVAYEGARDCGVPGIALANVPADSADALAVGGENIITDVTGAIVGSSGFIESGGAVSLLVAAPPAQTAVPGVNPAGRNVPDFVTGAVINGTGATYNVGGYWSGGGQFVNSPAVAGLLAGIEQMTGHRLGAFDRTLYMLFAKMGYGAAFSDVTLGCIVGALNDPPLCAKPGYDRTSGIGAVDGYRLGLLLR